MPGLLSCVSSLIARSNPFDRHGPISLPSRMTSPGQDRAMTRRIPADRVRPRYLVPALRGRHGPSRHADSVRMRGEVGPLIIFAHAARELLNSVVVESPVSATIRLTFETV